MEGKNKSFVNKGVKSANRNVVSSSKAQPARQNRPKKNPPQESNRLVASSNAASLKGKRKREEDGKEEKVVTSKLSNGEKLKQRKIESIKSKKQKEVEEEENEEEDEEEEVEEENQAEEMEDGEGEEDEDADKDDESADEGEEGESPVINADEISSDGGVLTEEKFESLDIHDSTKEAIRRMGFTKMREIQAKSVPPALEGKDILGKAKTGSGKTLAFLIPTIELLLKNNFTPKTGTGAIIISPTRELALQTFGVCHDLLKTHTLTHGVVIGGANRHAEIEKLRKGVNIVICTPGRLLDHLQNTKGFLFDNLKALVIDETDRILSIGFEEEMHKILRILPKDRQTMLFSATQTTQVEELANLSLKTPTLVGVEDNQEFATPAELDQGYVICTSEWRFLLLYTFLKKNLSKKIIVFFSSCKSVKFHGELLNYIDLPVLDLHGKQKQNKRTATFFEFKNAKSGILLCTDVAARGLDIPAVDWIIQYDPPDDPREYIHRVGRTARGTAGKALLFLLPHEIAFLQFLKNERVPLNEYDFPKNKIANVQNQLETLIEKNYYLHKSARDAYRGYILAYTSHSHKQIFDVKQLDLVKVAKGFGFNAPPKINLNIESSKEGFTKKGAARNKGAPYHQKKKGFHQKGRGSFSASNPYGIKDTTDKRQFSRI